MTALPSQACPESDCATDYTVGYGCARRPAAVPGVSSQRADAGRKQRWSQGMPGGFVNKIVKAFSTKERFLAGTSALHGRTKKLAAVCKLGSQPSDDVHSNLTAPATALPRSGRPL